MMCDLISLDDIEEPKDYPNEPDWETARCIIGVDHEQRVFVLDFINHDLINDSDMETITYFLGDGTGCDLDKPPGLYYCEMPVTYHKDWTDCGYEYDSDMEFENIHKIDSVMDLSNTNDLTKHWSVI